MKQKTLNLNTAAEFDGEARPNKYRNQKGDEENDENDC
jgi:hypothetical protein